MFTQFTFCGKKGIRTPDTLLTYTRFPGVPLQPLEHLSKGFTTWSTITENACKSRNKSTIHTKFNCKSIVFFLCNHKNSYYSSKKVVFFKHFTYQGFILQQNI